MVALQIKLRERVVSAQTCAAKKKIMPCLQKGLYLKKKLGKTMNKSNNMSYEYTSIERHEPTEVTDRLKFGKSFNQFMYLLFCYVT